MSPKVSENRVNYEEQRDFVKLYESDMVSDEVV